MNSLDPRSKCLRAARRSIAQARNSLAGARLALAPLANSRVAAATDFLESVDRTLEQLAEAVAILDRVAAEQSPGDA